MERVVRPDRPEMARLSVAVEGLATRAAPIQRRLVSAFTTIMPFPDHAFLEGDEQDTFRRIRAALATGGTYEDTALAMDAVAAENVAQDIWRLFWLVLSSERMDARRRDDETAVW